MKIFVTGATGFIGSHLVRRLAENRFEVICLVRKNSSKERIKELTRFGAKICYGDITDESSLKNLPSDVDVVYHLAALIDHTLTSYRPYHRVNVIGTQNLAKQFLESGVKKFIFVSSIAAIGLVKTETGLVDESVRCTPTTFYGKSKREAEKLLTRHFNNSQFPVIILRAPTVYGPGCKIGFLDMARFIKWKIEKRRPIFYIGKGTTLTSACYIDNLVDALILAMKSKYVGELFHIDDGRPYTIREIMRMISNALGGKPVEIYVPKVFFYGLACASEFLDSTLNISLKGLSRKKLEMLSTNMAFDIAKARKYLGYTPVNNFEEFVRKTIAWYEKNGLL